MADVPRSGPVNGGATLNREELWGHYDSLLAEYRFQVDLNWRRAAQLLALDAAILSAAVALAGLQAAPDVLVAAVFAIGAAVAGLAIYLTLAQHSYYRHVRSVKAAVEAELGLDALAIRSTRGMRQGSRRWWQPSVTKAVVLVFAMLFFSNAVAGVMLARS